MSCLLIQTHNLSIKLVVEPYGTIADRMKGKYIKLLGLLAVVGCLLVLWCNSSISKATRAMTYDQVEGVPENRVGLVLGTAKKLVDGRDNPYYTYRIEAAVQLYRAKKISYVLVSGDNGSKYYNEPTTIMRDLVEKGIPKDKIFLDYAGFRTLDSVVRAKEVFGLDSVTIISQRFHNERAIYLAHKKQLKAIGFNARDLSGKAGFKVRFREYFARVKVFIDLLFNTQPKFYGSKIAIK